MAQADLNSRRIAPFIFQWTFLCSLMNHSECCVSCTTESLKCLLMEMGGGERDRERERERKESSRAVAIGGCNGC